MSPPPGGELVEHLGVGHSPVRDYSGGESGERGNGNIDTRGRKARDVVVNASSVALIARLASSEESCRIPGTTS
jgi:hypothetical protein